MRFAIVILLVNALVAMPLSGFGLSDRGCCQTDENMYEVNADENQQVESCCILLGEQPGDDQPQQPAPCEDGECPMTCCATTAPPAFVLPRVNGLTQTMLTASAMHPCVEIDLGHPHLLRLKRPPRTV